MAVVIGEAAVRIRGDADKAEIQREIEPKVSAAMEAAGESGADAFSTKMAAGIAAAGAVVAGGFAAALEEAALGDKLAAQLGASGAESERYGQVAGDLYANAYGDSLGAVNDALRSVVQNVGGMADASSADLQAVTGSVLDLSTAMEQDVGATSAAVGRMIQTGLAANAEEALDVLTRGFQEGADRGGDLLDVVGEYGSTFSELGLNGSQSVGLINQALAAGIPNADFAADALREMGIIGREAGEGAAEALGSLGLNADNYFAAMQEGGPAASAALDSVLDALRNTEDPALRSAAAAELVGTQYEDLGDAILQMDPSTAVEGLGQVEGAVGNLGTTLNDNASTNLTTFWRTAQTAFVDIIGGVVVPIIETIASVLTSTFIPAIQGAATWIGDNLRPAIEAVATWLEDNLAPALDTIRGYVEDNVMPALTKFSDWLTEHKGTIEDIATGITIVLIPALARLGFAAIASGTMTLIGWGMAAAGAIGTGIVYVAQSALIVARWAAMSFAAILSAGLTVGAWIGMGISAVINAAVVAAAWLGAQIRTVASLAVMAAGFVVQGAIMAASMAGTVARVVAGWVLMGAQALLAAARMALAWFIALGPIGWVIALVVGLVALIIANWDKVKKFTVDAFNAIKDKVVGAFNAVVDKVKSGIGTVVDFVKGLPGKILSALGNLGSLLLNAGGDLIRGLVNGISKAASFVGDVAGSIFRAVRGFINEQVIDRLNGFLEFTIMGVTVNPPDIPRLHSGGVFTADGGEGLALLRDDELVATPEQRRVADDLLRGLLSGNLPGVTGTASTSVGGANVQIDVHPAPGMDERILAAHVGNDLGWQLSSGATRPVALLGGTA